MNDRITVLNEEIKQLRLDKIFFSSHLSVLMDSYYQNKNSGDTKKMEKLRMLIKEIDNKLDPALSEYKKLHHHYFVTFSSEMPEDVNNSMFRNHFQTSMMSRVGCYIDTSANGFDTSVTNFEKLVRDLGRQLAHSHSNVSFSRILKVYR